MTLTTSDSQRPAYPADCYWPNEEFGFYDNPGEHDPCYVVMPGGAMLALNHHAGEGVDIARAKFIVAACNAAPQPSVPAQSLPPHIEKTEAGIIDWKMEVERLNRLLAVSQRPTDRLAAAEFVRSLRQYNAAHLAWELSHEAAVDALLAFASTNCGSGK